MLGEQENKQKYFENKKIIFIHLQGSVTCESVIFVTDLPECCKQASSLAQFLQRVQSAVPEKLIKLARSYQQVSLVV